MLTYLQNAIASDYKDRYSYLYTYCVLAVSGYELYLEQLSHSFNIIGVVILRF